MNNEQRYQAFLQEVKQNQTIWILTDEHGCVILNSEDEDCAPVWPSEQDAAQWANSEWSHCEAKAISLKDWLQRWTPGLESDDLCVAVHPLIGESSMVVFPDTLDSELRK